MTELMFTVRGLPAPQGSKRHVGNGVMVEASKKVKPWRQDVKYAALEAIEMLDGFVKFDGPVELDIEFYHTRPKSHFRTGRNAHLLKETAPNWKITAPDLSKLVRSTEDACTEAGVWGDDRQVARIITTDRWSDWSGAIIKVSSLED